MKDIDIELYDQLQSQYHYFMNKSIEADRDDPQGIQDGATATGLGLAMAALYRLKQNDKEWLRQTLEIDAKAKRA